MKLKEAGVWSFTGYRKISDVKKYDGGGFYFAKSLLCFRPCVTNVTETGKCTSKQQYGVDKCCVTKASFNVSQSGEPTANACELRYSNEQLSRKQTHGRKNSLKKADGMKVY